MLLLRLLAGRGLPRAGCQPAVLGTGLLHDSLHRGSRFRSAVAIVVASANETVSSSVEGCLRGSRCRLATRIKMVVSG